MGFRRRLSRVLARWAVRVNPDPPLTFKLKSRVGAYPDLAEFERFKVYEPGGVIGFGKGETRPNPMPTSPPPGFAIPENER